MDRLGFFSYIKKSIVKTAVEMYAPFIEEDCEKIDQLVENLGGIIWVPVIGMQLNDEIGIKDLYVANKYLFSYFDGEEVHIYEKVCPQCHGIVHWLSYDKSIKCFQCDSTFKITERQEELSLKEYITKCENGVWFIGIL